jgi:hypothetical protein
MKYLKRIFEATGEKVELQEFCEMYLAYLIDDGFEVEVIRENIFKDSFRIRITTETGTITTTWDNIKDKIIPFFSMLVRNYNIGVKPEQKRPYHKSWSESTVSFGCYVDGSDVYVPSIDINKLIKDRPGYKLEGIYSIELIVHKK